MGTLARNGLMNTIRESFFLHLLVHKNSISKEPAKRQSMEINENIAVNRIVHYLTNFCFKLQRTCFHFL